MIRCPACKNTPHGNGTTELAYPERFKSNPDGIMMHICRLDDMAVGWRPLSNFRASREEILVGVIARLIYENDLLKAHGEDTIGVLMKCGVFHDTDVASLAGKVTTATLEIFGQESPGGPRPRTLREWDERGWEPK
jgi:hypothetical protein